MNIMRDHLLCSCGQCGGTQAVGWSVLLSSEMPLEAQQGTTFFSPVHLPRSASQSAGGLLCNELKASSLPQPCSVQRCGGWQCLYASLHTYGCMLEV